MLFKICLCFLCIFDIWFHRSFLQALLFVKSMHYVNTAQINPNYLYVDNYCLHVHERKLLAICIMVPSQRASSLQPVNLALVFYPQNLHCTTGQGYAQECFCLGYAFLVSYCCRHDDPNGLWLCHLE